MRSDMENNLDLFDRYVNDTLSSEERSNFQARLESEQDFKKEFEQYQVIVSGIAQAGFDELKDKLQQRELIHSGSKPDYFLYMRIAASIVLLTVLSYLAVNYFTKTDFQTLYSEYYEPYPNIEDPINRSSQYEDLSVYQLYEQREYQEVINRLSVAEALSDADHFYLGQSYLAVNDPENAIESLGQIDKKSRYYEAAQWYIALSLLKSEDSEKLQEYLRQIVDFQGDYGKKARDLLGEL